MRTASPLRAPTVTTKNNRAGLNKTGQTRFDSQQNLQYLKQWISSGFSSGYCVLQVGEGSAVAQW